MTTFLSKGGYKRCLASSLQNGGGRREMRMDVEWAPLQDLPESHMEEETEAGAAGALSVSTLARPDTKITAVGCRQRDAHCWEGHSAPICCRPLRSFILWGPGQRLGRVSVPYRSRKAGATNRAVVLWEASLKCLWVLHLWANSAGCLTNSHVPFSIANRTTVLFCQPCSQPEEWMNSSHPRMNHVWSKPIMQLQSPLDSDWSRGGQYDPALDNEM